MNQVLFELTFFGHPLVLTGWKIIGYTGVTLFTGRWIVQLFASHLAGRSTIPRLFWYLSLTGSLMLLAYFTFGNNDSVGILSNLFPSFIAMYNLYLDIRHGRQSGTSAIHPGEAGSS